MWHEFCKLAHGAYNKPTQCNSILQWRPYACMEGGMYTPIQVARLANIHDNTVRKWAGEYADLLSAQTTGRRLFTDEDVEVFRAIAALRKSGVPPGEVAERIRSQQLPVV